MYPFYMYYMSTQNNFHFVEKLKIAQEAAAAAAQVQQNPSPVITQASTVHLPSPVTPATLVSSPRVTPQVTPESTPHAA